MKHIKTFESFETKVNEGFLDYFKSREDIAKKFLELLKEEPLKALEAILPYYEDFIDQKSIPHKRELSTGKTTVDFLPNLSQIFHEKEKGSFEVDKSKLNLVSKITKEEILNLLSTHEDFSVSKMAKDIFGYMGFMFDKDVPQPKELK